MSFSFKFFEESIEDSFVDFQENLDNEFVNLYTNDLLKSRLKKLNLQINTIDTLKKIVQN